MAIFKVELELSAETTEDELSDLLDIFFGTLNMQLTEICVEEIKILKALNGQSQK